MMHECTMPGCHELASEDSSICGGCWNNPRTLTQGTPEDQVNNPSHYSDSDVEVIDAIEAWDLEWHENNVIKYVARSMKKGNRLVDLKKARWYLDRKIGMLEEAEND